MTENLRAILLGIIQGLTEFLPVSSSGHLEIANFLLGNSALGEENLMMTIVLHAATAISTLFVFRKDVWDIISGIFSTDWNDEKKFSLAIIISMVPAAILGLFFEDLVEQLFTQNIRSVGLMLLVTAALLYFADKARDTVKNVGSKEAILVGIAQAIATLPGISRSGATISACVLLGIDRTKAARFSFLMVVPLILGKMAKDFLDGDFSQGNINVVALTCGFVAAFITGYVACRWMIALVKNSKLSYFSIYCVLIGLIAIIVSFN